MKHDPYAALRVANFRYFIFGRTLFTLALQMQTVAVSWDIYQRLRVKTADAALALGMVGLVQVLPVVLLSLAGGQAADRFNRKSIVRGGMLLFSGCAIALIVLSRTAAPVGWYYLVLAVSACGRPFSAPAIAALYPTLVTRDVLPNAATWSSTLFQLSAMLGPALGGTIVAGAGATASYAINLGCALLALLTFSLTVATAAPLARTPVSWHSLLSGVRFVLKARLLLALISLDLFAVLLGGATALLPIFSSVILHAGPQAYGWLRAAPSFGAVMMALLITHLPPFRRAGRTMLLAVAGFGLATIVFGLSSNFWLSLVALVLTGMCDNVSVVVRTTVMQMITPDAMRGRVTAITTLFISCSNELGEVESGLTARWLGVVTSVVAGGFGTLLIVCGASLVPEIGRLGRVQDLKPSAIAEATDEELAAQPRA